jgi:methyl-accepting chemotaxis protein
MSENSQLSYQEFYNIKLKKFYEYVTDVMHDFSYAVHRTIREEENRRRIEIWRSSKNENNSALIWIELAKGDAELDPYVATDILRTMNEEGMYKLFFFTNTDINEDTQDVLDGKNHYIFTPKDIIETMDALEMKKVSKMAKKRKNVKVPSGYIIIRNHLKQNPPKGKKIFINTSTLSDMAENYIHMARQTFGEVDRLDDINNLSQETKDRFKTIQLKLLPELRKTLYFKFTERFNDLTTSIYNIVQNLIVYIGALIEMESEEEMSKARDAVEDELEKLRNIDAQLEEFYEEQMKKTERLSYNLLYVSIGVIVFMVVFYLIMLKSK